MAPFDSIRKFAYSIIFVAIDDFGDGLKEGAAHSFSWNGSPVLKINPGDTGTVLHGGVSVWQAEIGTCPRSFSGAVGGGSVSVSTSGTSR